MVSVERAQQYIDGTPKEADNDSEVGLHLQFI